MCRALIKTNLFEKSGVKNNCHVFDVEIYNFQNYRVMKIQGQIIDATTKAPLDGASITIMQGFTPTKLGTDTDNNGNFYYENPNLTNSNWISITYIGYENKILNITDANGVISLNRKADDAMAGVFVTAHLAKKRINTLVRNNNLYKASVAIVIIVASYFVYRQFKH